MNTGIKRKRVGQERKIDVAKFKIRFLYMPRKWRSQYQWSLQNWFIWYPFLTKGYWCFPEPLKQSPWFIYDDNYSTDENILLRISIRQNVLVHHVHVCNPWAAIAHNQMSNSIPKHQTTAHWLEYMCIGLSRRKCYSMPNIRMLNASTVSFITFIHFSLIFSRVNSWHRFILCVVRAREYLHRSQ